MQRKIDTLCHLMDPGDWPAAIRFAAKFPRLGKDRDATLRAKGSLNTPDFYRQIGRYPQDLIQAGEACLRERYPNTGYSNSIAGKTRRR